MSLKKFWILFTVLLCSLCTFAACVDKPQPKDPHKVQQDADRGIVRVCVLTRYELFEIEANFADYDSWEQLLQAEFDGRDESRAPVERRGGYVVAIGKLRPGNAGKISVYLNGVYSDLFAFNCPYKAGYTLAFVESGADIDLLPD